MNVFHKGNYRGVARNFPEVQQSPQINSTSSSKSFLPGCLKYGDKYGGLIISPSRKDHIFPATK